jgi:D-alanyl-D-alanine carboxypeptidase/D-alanyl-D-alanine-endopeptidase (penicillin-binding protein 4)
LQQRTDLATHADKTNRSHRTEHTKIKAIFPQAGVGTLGAMDRKEGEFIYAKTGSMSGIYCLSGYVLSKKGKWLSFSIMVNNNNSSSGTIRKKIEAFLQTL